MSELSELIRINKSIENQNKEIIRLLKIIAGEADYADRSGYVYPEFEEEATEVEDKFEEFENLLDNEIAVGEVYFMDGDIYRYSIENNEGVIDNLIGGEVTTNFNAVEKISNEKVSTFVTNDAGIVDRDAVTRNQLEQCNTCEGWRNCQWNPGRNEPGCMVQD